jgi:hypothetical protein
MEAPQGADVGGKYERKNRWLVEEDEFHIQHTFLY